MFYRRLLENISKGTCKQPQLNLTATFNAKTQEKVFTKTDKVCYTKNNILFVKVNSNHIITYFILLSIQMTNTRDMPKAKDHNKKDIIIIEDSEDEKVIKKTTVT